LSAAARLDAMDEGGARAALGRCCGAGRWVEGMLAKRPFGTDEALLSAADEVWATMERADILEAFSHHPRIGADVDELREKFAKTAELSATEQSEVGAASEEVLHRLRDMNVRYEERFGYIFIVCASGKSAGEMLEILESRIDDDPEEELRIAAGEQAKITRLRLAQI
jgi:2-oxo-4-hydroxy-4-carboxy-5-ureidoimidazoline decarboxylase